MILAFQAITLGICILSWYASGKVFQQMRLPAITGFIIAGMLTGPWVINPKESNMENLHIIESICLSYVALLAGAELQIGGIKNSQRQVVSIVASVSFFSWLFIFLCAFLISPNIYFLKILSRPELFAVCNLLGMLGVARSPASALAVLKEVQGSGPFCSLVMAVIVMKDVFVFFGFSFALRVAEEINDRNLQAIAYTQLALQQIQALVVSIIIAVVSGYIYGRVDNKLSLLTKSTKHLQWIFRAPLPLFIAACTFYVADRVHAEPLLACVGAGIMSTHYSNDAFLKGAPLLVVVSATLFGLVGASLHLRKLFRNAGLALAIVIIRIFGITVGTWVSGAMGAIAHPLMRHRFWQAMVTQAGIAMGLTRIVVARCKDSSWAADFEALMASIVIINLLIGPPLFKSAIIALGEGHQQESTASRREGAVAGGESPTSIEEGAKGRASLSSQSPSIQYTSSKTIPIIDLSHPSTSTTKYVVL